MSKQELTTPLVNISRYFSYTGFEQPSQTLLNHFIYLQQPLLYIRPKVLCIYLIPKAYLFSILRTHSQNLCIFYSEDQGINSLEALLEVVLNLGGITCLCQRRDQLNIRQEEEAGEFYTLSLQVLLQGPLYDLHDLQALLQVAQEVLEGVEVEDEGVGLNELDALLPDRVNELELGCLRGQGLIDVLEGKDGFQVYVSALYLHPHLQYLLYVDHDTLPLISLLLHELNAGVTTYHLSLNRMVIQEQLDIFQVLPLEDCDISFLPLAQYESHVLPLLLHLHHRILQAILLHCIITDLLDGLQELVHMVTQEITDRYSLRIEGSIEYLLYATPVPLLNTCLREHLNQWYQLHTEMKFLLEFIGYPEGYCFRLKCVPQYQRLLQEYLKLDLQVMGINSCHRLSHHLEL